MNAPMIAVNPMFSANAANKKQMTNPEVMMMIGAFLVDSLCAVYADKKKTCSDCQDKEE